ncbi:MAG: N-acetyltransferase [Rhizobiaceae bacterium]|nr:N-acetyltransferase [Rhizobiaceae bacterium]
MKIRDEQPGDEQAIHALTDKAFAGAPYSDGTEAEIVRLLRAAGDLALSLVAEEDDTIVGHVAFSPLTIRGDDGPWFGLGPISVEPKHQKQGIGRALVAEGLARLRERGARGCALIGDPNVYKGMGFESDGKLSYGEVPAKYVQRIVFIGAAPQGELHYAPAFGAAGSG